MNASRSVSAVARLTWVQMIIFMAGLFYMLVGLSMLFWPGWFYKTIGHFPPFNRHYIGDLGAFTLPLGLGLLLAARVPFQHRLLLWAVGSANLLHGLNHVYDSLAGQMSLTHWLADTIPLLLGAVIFLIAIWPKDRQ